MLSHLENCNQDDQAYLQAAHTAIACTQSRLPNNHQLLDQQLCGGDYVPPITMPSATPQLHPNIGTNGGEGGHVIGHYSGLQHYQNSTNSPPMDYRQSISEDRLSKTNIYIRGLPKEFNDQDLSRLCQSVGRIRSLKAIMDKDTNRCKGYGFVDFETSESAISALKKINSSTNYHAQMAKQQEQDPTNLYFANLSSTVNEVILEEVLAEFGQVISARILRDNNTRSKGVGFARMETKEICDNIIDALNGKKDSRLGDKEILVKFADGSKKSKHSSHHNRFSNTLSPVDMFAAQSSFANSFNAGGGYASCTSAGQLQLLQHHNPVVAAAAAAFIDGVHNNVHNAQAFYRTIPSAYAAAVQQQHNSHHQNAAFHQQLSHPYNNAGGGPLYLINNTQCNNISSSSVDTLSHDADGSSSPRILSPQQITNAYHSPNDHNIIVVSSKSGIVNGNNNGGSGIAPPPPIYFAAAPTNFIQAGAATMSQQQLAAALSQLHISNTAAAVSNGGGHAATYFSPTCTPAAHPMHYSYPYQLYPQNQQQSTYHPHNLYHHPCNTNNATLMAAHPQLAGTATAGYLPMAAAGTAPPGAVNGPVILSYLDNTQRCYIPSGIVPVSHGVHQCLLSDSCSSSEQDELSNHNIDMNNNERRHQQDYRNDSDASDHVVESGFNCNNSIAASNRITTSAMRINPSSSSSDDSQENEELEKFEEKVEEDKKVQEFDQKDGGNHSWSSVDDA